MGIPKVLKAHLRARLTESAVSRRCLSQHVLVTSGLGENNGRFAEEVSLLGFGTQSPAEATCLEQVSLGGGHGEMGRGAEGRGRRRARRAENWGLAQPSERVGVWSRDPKGPRRQMLHSSVMPQPDPAP